MKTYLLFLFCMALAIFTSAQDRSHQLMEVEVTPPRFTGVEEVMNYLLVDKTNNLDNYVVKNFKYPEYNGYNAEGTEVIRFDVTTGGELANFKIINSVSDAIDSELIRILKTTNGMWKPGYNNGIPVAMENEIAVEIRTGEIEFYALKKDFQKEAKHCFVKGTDLLLMKGKARRAVKFYDKGIRLRPYDQSLYYVRGLARYELGQIEGARQDWMRLRELGGIDMEPILMAENVKHLKGYQELSAMFIEK